jgi:chaperonin GroES
MTSTIAPQDDRVIIIQDPAEQVSEGGILIPEESQNRETIGTVVAVGPGEFYDFYDFGGTTADYVERRKPMNYRVGDRVLFPKYAGANVKIGGQEFQVMKQEQIIAILGFNDAVSELMNRTIPVSVPVESSVDIPMVNV